MFHQWSRQRWEKDSRYYEILLHQDLWGDWVLTRIWGRRGTELGREVHTPCVSYLEARERLTAVKARRKRRGYLEAEIIGKLAMVSGPRRR